MGKTLTHFMQNEPICHLFVTTPWYAGSTSIKEGTERDIHISESLLNLMETWNKEYSSGDSAAGPTPEQLEMIRKFKENGWV